jgi:hypothetical protein
MRESGDERTRLSNLYVLFCNESEPLISTYPRVLFLLKGIEMAISSPNGEDLHPSRTS